MGKRACSRCGATLAASATRCARCGWDLPERQGMRCNPDDPRCGVCGAAMDLDAEACPSCGEVGYPAMRPRRGKTSRGVQDEFRR